MLSSSNASQVLHNQRTTVILYLTGLLLIVPLSALCVSRFLILEWTPRHALLHLRASRLQTLVVYHYYEHQPHHDNFLFFLKHGVHGAADFVFVLNGDVSKAINASLPEHLSNVRVIRRDNTCYDMGSYGVVLNQLDAEGRLAQYKAIVLMNASVIGPIVPTYVTECWTRIFTNRLSGSVGLVGTTMNCIGVNETGPVYYYPHLQSMLLTFNAAALAVVRPSLECFQTKKEAIIKAEIPILKRVLAAGLQASMLDGFIASPLTEVPYASCQWGNVYQPGCYHGVDLNPHDVVFFKNTKDTRGVSADYLALYTDFMALRNYSSWDRC